MGPSNNSYSKLQSLYKEEDHEKVRKTGLSEPEAKAKYSRYVDFVIKFSESDKNVLDVGCGSGWSTLFLSERGLNSTGCDLHGGGYEPTESKTLHFVQGDILSLPFADNSFDIVTTNECLEHVPNPEKALQEMVRVTKPGGAIVVVGPNLLSLGHSLRALLKYVWQNNPKTRILFRDKDLPRHPLGNTLPEVLYFLIRNIILWPIKYLIPRPLFMMREPDLRPPFHADSDSCYLLNPADLRKYFSDSSKFKIIQVGPPGRSTLLEPLAAGTWFSVRKKAPPITPKVTLNKTDL